MRSEIKIRPVPKPALRYTPAFDQSLQILTWNRAELIAQLRRKQRTNPFLRELKSNWLDFQTQSSSFKEDLYTQLHTLNQPHEETICQILIESLNDRGLLDESLEELARTFHSPLSVWEEQLRLLQQLEPAGIAARSAQEYLILQLQRRGQTGAINFLTQCEAEILSHDWAGAAAKMQCSEQEIEAYFQQLQECTPFPCAADEPEVVSWILPEFEVRIEDDHCVLESLQEPDLELNETPTPELAQALQEARFFLDALNRRSLTLSLIMNELLQIQELPLIRRMPLHVCQKKTIARRVGIHPSTLTRAIQDKYFLFRGKLLPIEVLFTSASVQNNSHAELTALIRQQIDQESSDCPLSDLQIAMRLREENLNVSRQLIAKLRKAAGIPSSYHRRLDNG